MNIETFKTDLSDYRRIEAACSKSMSCAMDDLLSADSPRDLIEARERLTVASVAMQSNGDDLFKLLLTHAMAVEPGGIVMDDHTGEG